MNTPIPPPSKLIRSMNGPLVCRLEDCCPVVRSLFEADLNQIKKKLDFDEPFDIFEPRPKLERQTNAHEIRDPEWRLAYELDLMNEYIKTLTETNPEQMVSEWLESYENAN